MEERKKKQEKEPYPFDTRAQIEGREQPTTGEPAIVSGIYEIANHVHSFKEGFFVKKGSLLPSCPLCGQPVKFRLIKKIVHISEDADFR